MSMMPLTCNGGSTQDLIKGGWENDKTTVQIVLLEANAKRSLNGKMMCHVIASNLMGERTIFAFVTIHLSFIINRVLYGWRRKSCMASNMQKRWLDNTHAAFKDTVPVDFLLKKVGYGISDSEWQELKFFLQRKSVVIQWETFLTTKK